MSTITILERLISYPTISSNPITELASFCAQHAEDLGFEVRQFESTPGKTNVFATIGPQENSLVLSGHMDVVPTDGQEWTGDPFKLRHIGNKLMGRGACDMKGFIASVMQSLSEVPLKNLKRGLTLAWTHDEEIGCIGAQHLMNQLDNIGYIIPKSVLIGEPTSMKYSRLHGGHTTIEVSIQGRAAHSSKPELGLSALECAAEIIEAVNNLQADWRASPIDVEGKACHPLIHVAQIVGGAAINIIPEKCQLRLGLRAMPSQDSRNLVLQLRERINTILDQGKWRNIKAQITVPQDAPPLHSCKNSELEHCLDKFHLSEGEALPFSTDAGWFSRKSAIPLICGPGQIDIAHQPDEYIERNELEECDSLIKSLVLHWCHSSV